MQKIHNQIKKIIIKHTPPQVVQYNTICGGKKEKQENGF